MTDSFFTSRNQVDPQIEHSTAVFANELVEAGVRRLVRLEGPMATAVRVQRLADICAGAHVLPIEHWRRAKTTPTKRPWLKRFLNSITWTYWLGFVVGYWIGRHS